MRVFCSSVLEAFAKLRQATISFMSARPSARMERLGSHLTNFHKIDIEIFFANLSNSSFVKSDKNN
jgi:hypothetical protein